MKSLAETIGYLFGALAQLAATVLFAILLNFLGGAIAGLLVGWCFPVTFATFFAGSPGAALAPWQIGGMLGFIGGFFRTVVLQRKE